MLPSVGKTHGTWVKCKNLVCLFLRFGDQTQISNPFYRYLKHLVVQPADTIFHAQKHGFIFSLIIYNIWSHFYFSNLCSFLRKKSPFKKVKEKKIKKQARDWEKLFVKQICDKGLICRIYKDNCVYTCVVHIYQIHISVCCEVLEAMKHK